MKPGIPETGTVIRLEGENAVVRMKSEGGSCGKCGVAAAGLCQGGLVKVLTVKNSKCARVGDTVKIGLSRGIQYRGYVLAYVMPSTALVLGAVGGHFLGIHTGYRNLDVIAGFLSLIAVSVLSLMRLIRLDSSSSIDIVKVLHDPWNPGP
jgi:positive regulator of sigma E activity